MEAIIISLYMDNIPPEFRRYQHLVMDKFNVKKYAFEQTRTNLNHGDSMDYIMQQAVNSPLNEKGPVVVVFMDIDCIPLNDRALEYYIETAKSGFVVGHAQRSNHIANDQHIYCGSPLVALSVETYKKLGQPSARPTARGDVAEEWTWKAEEAGIEPQIILPTKFDAPPFRMAWETNTEPFWRLKDDQHTYGVGTTYPTPGVSDEGTWHMFQSFHGNGAQTKRFVAKCEEVLNQK